MESKSSDNHPEVRILTGDLTFENENHLLEGTQVCQKSGAWIGLISLCLFWLGLLVVGPSLREDPKCYPLDRLLGMRKYLSLIAWLNLISSSIFLSWRLTMTYWFKRLTPSLMFQGLTSPQSFRDLRQHVILRLLCLYYILSGFWFVVGALLVFQIRCQEMLIFRLLVSSIFIQLIALPLLTHLVKESLD